MACRKAVLFMDNFSAHCSAVNAVEAVPAGVGFCNTKIVLMPPNTTSKTQPLNPGIISTFKALYRRSWLRYIVEEFEAGNNPIKTMNILKAIRFTICAWDEVSSKTIANCWLHSNHKSPSRQTPQLAQPAQVVEAAQVVSGLIQQLYDQQRIHEAMDISQILTSSDELINDSLQDSAELIAQHMGQFRLKSQKRRRWRFFLA